MRGVQTVTPMLHVTPASPTSPPIRATAPPSPSSPVSPIPPPIRATAPPLSSPLSASTWRLLFRNDSIIPAERQGPVHGPRVPHHDQLWWTTLRSLILMGRNVLWSSSIVWVIALCCSQVGSWTASTTPSRVMTLGASMLWVHFWTSSIDLIMFSCRIWRLRMPGLGGRRATLPYAMLRLGRATLVHNLVCYCSLLLGAWVLSHGYSSKIAQYFIALVTHYFFAACDTVARRIFLLETVQGQQKLQQQEQAKQQQQFPKHTQQTRSPLGMSHEGRQILRAFIKRSPLVVSILLASGYVHVVSQWHFTSDLRVRGFLAGSLALKFVSQELAKQVLIYRGVTNVRSMSVVVGVPTVLIDTQMRVVILRTKTTEASWEGIALLAVAELAVRMGKVFLLWCVIRRKWRRHDNDRTASALAGLVRWRAQILALHLAETSADMYAKYIALACSTAISVLYTTHAQYVFFTMNTATTTTGLGQADSRTLDYRMLLGQLALELGVDYVASLLENATRPVMDDITGLSLFLGVLFMRLAVMNIAMSSLLYLR